MLHIFSLVDNAMSSSLKSDGDPTISHVDIAIPVRNEEDRLAALLTALAQAASNCLVPVTAVVLANNCTDASVEIARSFHHPALKVSVRPVTFSTPQASAGRARRMAMDLAARPGGLLMTTDADAVPCANWIQAAAVAVRAGADLICGAISADVPHVLATPSGARITRAEKAYSGYLHLIRHCLDQISGRQPNGSEKPHYMESGASMAIRADCYFKIGGLPVLDSSEDRALVYRAETHGLTVRYSRDMHAHVSARLQGRADGGMAACLRHRMQDDDPFADQAMLLPEMMRKMWIDAMSGCMQAYPDRSISLGSSLRASDLEMRLHDLIDLYENTVRPHFAAWSLRNAQMVAE